MASSVMRTARSLVRRPSPALPGTSPPYLRTDQAGGLPDFVRDELTSYLDCGIPERGCVASDNYNSPAVGKSN